MTSALFSPIRLRGLTLANRIVVSPMCQYSAREGLAGDWHLVHLGGLAVGGFGLVFAEATAVEPRGRITPGCLGLYSDACEAALARVVAFCREHGNGAIALQLAHAGRKASCEVPWRGRMPLPPERGGWRPVAPSAVPFDADHPLPEAIDETGLAALREAFAEAARRAARIGFDLLEIHGAHGYLMHQFLSPLSNRRRDGYGGALAARMRFPLEVFEAVRAAWPAAKPLGVRISASDHVAGGWDLDQATRFAAELKARGSDFIDVSSGGTSPAQQLTPGPGFQVPFAAHIRAQVGIPTIAVGMITRPDQAEAIVADGRADLVAMARGVLLDPRWPWHAAEALGARAAYPRQYERCRPEAWREAFGPASAAAD